MNNLLLALNLWLNVANALHTTRNELFWQTTMDLLANVCCYKILSFASQYSKFYKCVNKLAEKWNAQLYPIGYIRRHLLEKCGVPHTFTFYLLFESPCSAMEDCIQIQYVHHLVKEMSMFAMRERSTFPVVLEIFPRLIRREELPASDEKAKLLPSTVDSSTR